MEISRQWKRVTRCVTNQVVGKLTSEGAKRPSRDKMFNRMGTTKLWENKFLNVQYIYSSFDVHAKLRRLEKEAKRVVVGRNVGIRWPKWPKRRKTLNRGEFSRRRQNVKRTQATRALRWKHPKTGQNDGIFGQNDGKRLTGASFPDVGKNVKRTQATRALWWKLPKTGQNHGIFGQNVGKRLTGASFSVVLKK